MCVLVYVSMFAFMHGIVGSNVGHIGLYCRPDHDFGNSPTNWSHPESEHVELNGNINKQMQNGERYPCEVNFACMT